MTLCDDSDEQARFFAAAGRSRRSGARWWWRCGPTVSASCRRTRRSPGLVERGFVPARRDGRGRPARRHRGAGASGRSAAGAGSRRPAGPRGRRRTGCPSAAVPRPAPDVAASARAGPSPSPATARPAASAGRSPSRPRRSTSGCRPNSGRCCVTSCSASSPPSPDGEPVRSRVPRRTLVTDDVHDELIEQLVAARLVTSDDDVVELAHEALARAWPRLRGWLDDDVDGQRILRHLAGAADTWDAMGRPDSELYRGLRLTQASTGATAPVRAQPDRAGVPRRRHGARRGRAAHRRGPGAASGSHQPTVAGAARRRGRAARGGPRRRAAGVAPGGAGRRCSRRRRRSTSGGAGARRIGRRSGPAARGRGGCARRLARHPGEPAGRAVAGARR